MRALQTGVKCGALEGLGWLALTGLRSCVTGCGAAVLSDPSCFPRLTSLIASAYWYPMEL
jgi:hypothetical protein